MITRNEYQEMLAEMRADGFLCVACDDMPAFEDTNYCEDCLAEPLCSGCLNRHDPQDCPHRG